MIVTIKKIWNDPVGSSVISGLCVALIIWIFSKIFARIKGISISEYFKRQISISVGKITLFGSAFFIIGILIYSFQEQISLYKDALILFGPYTIGLVILIYSFTNGLKAADRLVHKFAKKIDENEANTEVTLQSMVEYEKEINCLKSKIERLEAKENTNNESDLYFSINKLYLELKNSKAKDDFGEILKRVSNYSNVGSYSHDILDYMESKGLMYRNNGWEGMYNITIKGQEIYALFLDDLMKSTSK